MTVALDERVLLMLSVTRQNVLWWHFRLLSVETSVCQVQIF